MLCSCKNFVQPCILAVIITVYILYCHWISNLIHSISVIFH